MKKFNVKPLGAIISGLIMAAATQSVLAQSADAQDEPVVEEITVTGFAKSIATAIETKRNADTVIQAISAEDIGGLPDKSIADSLSRLPGVTVTRKGGQAGTIQVRGMGEGFVFSTLNGREQVSPTGNRAMEYSQFPSELISSVEVYMSPKASLIEGGVAGTVELKTVNPLAMTDDQKINIGVRGNYNDQASDMYDTDPMGHRISFAYQKKLLDDTLGLSLGYAQLKEPKAAITYENFPYDKDSVVPDRVITNGMKMIQESGVTERDGYMAAVHYEPNENLSIQSDAFYSKFDIASTKRGVFFDRFEVAQISNADYYGPYMTGGYLTGNATDGPKGGFTINIANDKNTQSYELFSGGVNAKWTEDAVTLSLDLAHSDASGYELNGNGVAKLYMPSATNPGTYVVRNDQTLNYRLNGMSLPNIAVGADYTDPTTIRLESQAYYPYLNEDKVDAVRFDIKYELDDVPVISSVEAGMRYSKRNHKQSREIFKYGDIVTDLPLQVTADTSDVVHWKGAFSNMPSFLAVDGEEILRQAIANGLVLRKGDTESAYDANGNLLPRSTDIAKRWSDKFTFQENSDIDENVASFYMQANIKTVIADRDLTGNVGMRIVNTDQSNISLADVNADPALGAVNICDIDGVCNDTYAYKRRGTKYSNLLPSLNLNYHLTESDQLRGALARVLSRAPINKLSSFDFGNVDISKNPPVYNYGDDKSPMLTPFIADQIDISYEHYMEETNGSFSIAAYYREIKSFIQSTSIEQYDFDADPAMSKPPTAVVNNGGTLVEEEVVDGTYKFALNNDSGGYIQGLEFAYTQTFTFLPSYWSGLGFSGSLSFTDSAITVANPQTTFTSKLAFPGLVEKSGNFTVFYAYESFETRLSTTYQDAFVGENRTIGPILQAVTYAPELVMDYQASYKFDSGIDLVFSVGNVTNEPNRTYVANEELTQKLNWFGRTYNLGANYTF